MTARVICFASAKGGSGKTTVSAALSMFLGGVGKRVLLIDTDAATNGLTLVYVAEAIAARDGIQKQTGPSFEIFEAKGEELPTVFSLDDKRDMIPAAYVLTQTQSTPVPIFEGVLRSTLAALQDTYDYIILDAQAGADEYAIAAMKSAHEVVIVSEYDEVSAEGVERMRRLDALKETLTFDRTRVLLNKVLPELVQVGEFLGIMRYLSPIPWNADVVREFAHRKIAVNMERGNIYTLAIMQMAVSLLGTSIQERADRWRSDKEDAIKEPSQKELEVTESELSDMEGLVIERQYVLGAVTTIQWVITSVVVLSLAVDLIITGFAVWRLVNVGASTQSTRSW